MNMMLRTKRPDDIPLVGRVMRERKGVYGVVLHMVNVCNDLRS
jgi:hypothetical protein